MLTMPFFRHFISISSQNHSLKFGFLPVNFCLIKEFGMIFASVFPPNISLQFTNEDLCKTLKEQIRSDFNLLIINIILAFKMSLAEVSNDKILQ